VENTGRKQEDLSGWKIERVIDGNSKIPFSFDRNFAVRPGGKVKIWAGGKGPGASRDDIECGENSWGIGANITTKLLTQAARIGPHTFRRQSTSHKSTIDIPLHPTPPTTRVHILGTIPRRDFKINNRHL